MLDFGGVANGAISIIPDAPGVVGAGGEVDLDLGGVDGGVGAAEGVGAGLAT